MGSKFAQISAHFAQAEIPKQNPVLANQALKKCGIGQLVELSKILRGHDAISLTEHDGPWSAKVLRGELGAAFAAASGQD